MAATEGRPAAAPPVPRCGRVRLVRPERREVHEERLVARRRADESVGAAGEHVGGVVARLVPVPAAVGEPVVEVGTADVAERRERVPARRLVAGARLVGEVVEVLAEQPGPVAAALQGGGDRPVLHAPPPELRPAAEPVAADVAVAEDPRVVRVQAGEDRGARRAAQRRRDHRVGEGRALLHQQGLHGRHRAEGVGALVVGQEQHDVGAGPRVAAVHDRAGRGRQRAGVDRGQHQAGEHRGSGKQPPRTVQRLRGAAWKVYQGAQRYSPVWPSSSRSAATACTSRSRSSR